MESCRHVEGVCRQPRHRPHTAVNNDPVAFSRATLPHHHRTSRISAEKGPKCSRHATRRSGMRVRIRETCRSCSTRARYRCARHCVERALQLNYPLRCSRNDSRGCPPAADAPVNGSSLWRRGTLRRAAPDGRGAAADHHRMRQVSNGRHVDCLRESRRSRTVPSRFPSPAPGVTAESCTGDLNVSEAVTEKSRSTRGPRLPLNHAAAMPS